ncbi:hypothetical protein DBR32_02765 [Taibaiella sp. KBW10]|uniref:hypothetical protein n=1 Tax=Taibaiella sp. KBW10 TaxID=2153357 RepID=UPI000F5930CA|nr:hypothetical protein [Taibaiella sp. KBW10]RQO32538.1 hypothetical protein DBR32_02765 [Taibaiella sp. KBW10]
MKPLIILTIALTFLWSKAIAQKRFTTKGLKVYASPVYSFNTPGITYLSPYIKYNADKQKFNVPEGYNYRPATLNIPNTLNIAAGLEYEFYLKNGWYVGVDANYRTAHTKVQYSYNSDALYGENKPVHDPVVLNYTQKLKTMNFGLYGGKQFKLKKTSSRWYEVRLGLGMAFNANKITGNKNYEYSAVWQVINNVHYYAPFTNQYGKGLNRNSIMNPENMRLSLYFGSEGKKPLIKGTRIYGFYGLQGDFNFVANRSLYFLSYYAYQGTPQAFQYKTQQANYSVAQTVNLSAKVGLMLK